MSADAAYPAPAKLNLMLRVTGRDQLDGYRFQLEGGWWLLLRFSGTEPLLRIYAEIGKKLVVDAVAEGGGTDAAFASLETKAPVLERFGLQGFGAHSNDAEYVAVDSIEPRLYLLTRLIMDVSQGKDSQ